MLKFYAKRISLDLQRAELMVRLETAGDDEITDELAQPLAAAIHRLDLELAQCMPATPLGRALAVRLLRWEFNEEGMFAGRNPRAEIFRNFISIFGEGLPPVPADIETAFAMSSTAWRDVLIRQGDAI